MKSRFEELERLSERISRVEAQREEMIRAFTTAIPCISKLSPEGTYLFINDEYANALGYKPDEMVGKSWKITVHPDDLLSVQQAYEDMKESGTGTSDARAIHKDGSSFLKRIHLSDLENGGSYYCFMQVLKRGE